MWVLTKAETEVKNNVPIPIPTEVKTANQSEDVEGGSPATKI